MASGPVTSWQIDGEILERVTDFIFLSSKIIADGDCNHEIKSHLLLGRKAMTNLVKSSQVKSLSRVQLFATPVDCSPPGSPVQRILQARILE